jgi:TRAP-type C4-dicarboxylate transport system permease small subunit
MSKAAAAFLAVERRVTAAIAALAMALMAAAALVAFYQVVTRFVLQQPATWSEVLVRTLIVWMVYLGAAAGFRVGALVSVDALARFATGPWKRTVETVAGLSALVLLFVGAWWGWQVAWRLRFQNLAGLDVSIMWLYAAVPAGCLFAMLAVVARLLDPGPREEAIVD